MTKRELQKREDKIKEEVTVLKIGRSYYLRLSPAQREYLEVEEGTTLKTQTEYSDNYGRYISGWNPEQQTGDEE